MIGASDVPRMISFVVDFFFFFTALVAIILQHYRLLVPTRHTRVCVNLEPCCNHSVTKVDVLRTHMIGILCIGYKAKIRLIYLFEYLTPDKKTRGTTSEYLYQSCITLRDVRL